MHFFIIKNHHNFSFFFSFFSGDFSLSKVMNLTLEIYRDGFWQCIDADGKNVVEWKWCNDSLMMQWVTNEEGSDDCGLRSDYSIEMLLFNCDSRFDKRPSVRRGSSGDVRKFSACGVILSGTLGPEETHSGSWWWWWWMVAFVEDHTSTSSFKTKRPESEVASTRAFSEATPLEFECMWTTTTMTLDPAKVVV
jgi:hypothetical protein